jgi:hypothetical protein
VNNLKRLAGTALAAVALATAVAPAAGAATEHRHIVDLGLYRPTPLAAEAATRRARGPYHGQTVHGHVDDDRRAARAVLFHVRTRSSQHQRAPFCAAPVV